MAVHYGLMNGARNESRHEAVEVTLALHYCAEGRCGLG
jgi:hypothetical protein